MATERFSKEQFEQALPVDSNTNEPLWVCDGFINGEWTYFVPIPNRHIAVLVRSSVKEDGYAAETGGDSIRLVLVNSITRKPVAEKLNAWTTRVPGWDARMVDKIRELYRRGLEMANCPKCDGVLIKRSGKFGEFYGCSNYPRCRYTTQTIQQPTPAPVKKVLHDEPVDVDSIDFGEIFSELNNGGDDQFSFEEEIEPLFDSEDSQEEVSVKKEPNQQQLRYIEAPIDANMRVVAAPGSGKTFSSIERIAYLIERGVDPDAIVYVTFTKSMATEGFERLVRRLPQVEGTALEKQVCTIHALCYRMLREHGIKRNVPKEWEVKKALTNIICGDDREGIKGIWQHAAEKPGYKEVLYWIDKAKSDGITDTDDFRFFLRFMIHDHAAKLHEARVAFDKWLKDNNYITFSDMPFMIEQLVMRDRAFREQYQARYTHILVDEAQDTTGIALRILITLSLEPGDNRVYEKLALDNISKQV